VVGVDLELRAKAAELETRVNEYERRLYYMDKYVEMIQKQQLDKTKLLRELIRVEGKRSRSRGVGIAVLAAMLGHSLLTNPRYQWDVVGAYLLAPPILAGVVRTLALTATAMLAGIVLGVALNASWEFMLHG